MFVEEFTENFAEKAERTVHCLLSSHQDGCFP